MSDRNKIKILWLTNWMAAMAEPERIINGRRLYSDIPDCVVPMEPVFNRDGCYLERLNNGSRCWFECSGKAWTYDAECFKLPFENIYSEYEIKALKAITKTKFATKAQHELLGKIIFDQRERVEDFKIKRTIARVRAEYAAARLSNKT